MNSPCTLAGTFEIGEKLRPAQMRAIEQAQATQGDIVLLVNDLGVAQKMLAYEALSDRGVNQLYAKRLACAKTGCQISQLPKNDMEIEQFRDGRAIAEMVKVLSAYTSSRDIKTVQRICSEVLVPEQIRKRLALYGVNPQHVRVYTNVIYEMPQHVRCANGISIRKKVCCR